MYKYVYSFVKNLFAENSKKEALVFEFSIYDAISLGVITVVIWWLFVN
jgi:hypothetical protein